MTGASSLSYLHRSPDGDLVLTLEIAFGEGDPAVARIAILATKPQRPGLAGRAIECRQILRQELRLPPAETAFRDHQHVVAPRFPQRIDRIRHPDLLEHIENKINVEQKLRASGYTPSRGSQLPESYGGLGHADGKRFRGADSISSGATGILHWNARNSVRVTGL